MITCPALLLHYPCVACLVRSIYAFFFFFFVSGHTVLCHAVPCSAIVPCCATPCRCAMTCLACRSLSYYLLMEDFTPMWVERENEPGRVWTDEVLTWFLLEPDPVRGLLCSPRVQSFVSFTATPSMMASSDCWSSIKGFAATGIVVTAHDPWDSLRYRRNKDSKERDRTVLATCFPENHHEDWIVHALPLPSLARAARA